MKTLSLLTLLIFHFSLFIVHSQEQPCLPEGITFETQAQIDNFQENYPGCTMIEGDVNISGPDITNLIGLSSIISIGGILEIG